jgi:NitT/TauT family transport system substrate-binding protein
MVNPGMTAFRINFELDSMEGHVRFRQSEMKFGIVKRGKAMKTSNAILGVFLVISVTIFARLSMAASLEKIRFPYSPIGLESLPWWVAKDAKIFEKYGLDVDMLFEGASSAIIQDMLSGQANLAGVAGPAVIGNVLKGGDVIQVAAVIKTFDIPMYSEPSISDLADLKGKKVGVSRFGAISHFEAVLVLQRAGVKEVTIIQTGGIPESMAALSSGAVAAAMVTPPQSVLLRDKGFRELVGIKQLRAMNIPFVGNGIAARRSYAEKNPETVKRFIKAAFEGIKRIFDDKAFSMNSLADYTKLKDPKLLEESYRFAVDVFEKDPHVPPEAQQALVEQLIPLKMIDAEAARKTPTTAYYDNRYVDELEKDGFFKSLWQR